MDEKNLEMENEVVETKVSLKDKVKGTAEKHPKVAGAAKLAGAALVGFVLKGVLNRVGKRDDFNDDIIPEDSESTEF